MCDLDHTWLTYESAQIGSCHGPAGGAPAAGVDRGVPTERIPRGTPPNLAWQGEIATKTQELRPALSVNTQPNHVLPLAHFGATSDVWRDGGVVRTDHHDAGERSGSTQQYDLNEGPPCICWWLVKPITGQAPSTAATLWSEQRKASYLMA
jgi:hypothetical protein